MRMSQWKSLKKRCSARAPGKRAQKSLECLAVCIWCCSRILRKKEKRKKKE
jgi:hypothetical protein